MTSTRPVVHSSIDCEITFHWCYSDDSPKPCVSQLSWLSRHQRMSRLASQSQILEMAWCTAWALQITPVDWVWFTYLNIVLAANNKEVSRTPSQALTKVISASISYRGRWCRPCIYEIAAKGMGMLSKDEGGLAVHACEAK